MFAKKICSKIFIGLVCLTFVSTSAQAAFERKVKVSSNDSTSGYLNGKIVSGSNTTVVENNDGGNETLQINAVTSGSGVILDLADDASNESVALSEIATTNDPDNIATEPTADKLLLDFAPVILETELDSEAELEAQLVGVSNVFTNNDGALNDDDLTNNTIDNLSDVTHTTVAATQILIRNAGNTAYENKTMSGDCTLAATGAITCSTGSQWTDAGAYLEPNTDGDGINLSDSGGTKSVQIVHNGTEAVFDVTGASPLYRFPDLPSCDTIDTDANGVLTCGTDASGAGGTANILDLGDDASNESTDLIEIATLNDTNSVFTEPTADKLLINLANNWPSSDTADALSANGANCSAGNYPLGVDASGAVESCTADDDVPEVGDFDAFVGGNHTTYDTATDQLNLDAEVVNHMRSITIFDPTTADTNKVQDKLAVAVTITRVSCSTDTGTATIQLDERAEGTPNSAGTDVMTSALVCDNNSEATTSFTNAGIAADAPLNLQITATASTPTVVRIHVEYTIDDV